MAFSRRLAPGISGWMVIGGWGIVFLYGSPGNPAVGVLLCVLIAAIWGLAHQDGQQDLIKKQQQDVMIKFRSRQSGTIKEPPIQP